MGIKDADVVWAAADLIVKVTEPIAPEWKRIKRGQIIFTYSIPIRFMASTCKMKPWTP